MTSRPVGGSSVSSRVGLAVVATAACALSALGLWLTGERPAGIGDAEPVALLGVAVVFAGCVVATTTGATVAAVWAGRVAVVLVAALAFLSFTEPGWSSVVFTEAAAVFCGVLFVTSSTKAHPR